ncbi:unnamed protein product, partial [Meganyctiphanes norvegica]
VEIIDLKDGDKKDDESITPENIEPKEDKPETDAQGTKKTCWFWVNRKCKFGNQCKDDHPVQCKSMMETGRCSDSRCKLIHPKICRGSTMRATAAEEIAGMCTRQILSIDMFSEI